MTREKSSGYCRRAEDRLGVSRAGDGKNKKPSPMWLRPIPAAPTAMASGNSPMGLSGNLPMGLSGEGLKKAMEEILS